MAILLPQRVAATLTHGPDIFTHRYGPGEPAKRRFKQGPRLLRGASLCLSAPVSVSQKRRGSGTYRPRTPPSHRAATCPSKPQLTDDGLRSPESLLVDGELPAHGKVLEREVAVAAAEDGRNRKRWGRRSSASWNRLRLGGERSATRPRRASESRHGCGGRSRGGSRWPGGVATGVTRS